MAPQQVRRPILSHREILPSICQLWTEAPEIAAQARAGQFVMVRCSESYDPLLRRPLSIHQVGEGRKSLALLFAVVGRGTEWLSRRKKGESLDLLGPLGSGFEIYPTSQDLLLVAGGMGVAPLVALAEEAVARHCKVTLLLGGETKAQIYPRSLMSSEIRLVVATKDGSAGKKGLVTDLLPRFAEETDQIFACGPAPMYQTMAGMGLPADQSVQVLLEERMGCGLGACLGCAVATRSGPKLVCRDGPIFELSEVIW